MYEFEVPTVISVAEKPNDMSYQGWAKVNGIPKEKYLLQTMLADGTYGQDNYIVAGLVYGKGLVFESKLFTGTTVSTNFINRKIPTSQDWDEASQTVNAMLNRLYGPKTNNLTLVGQIEDRKPKPKTSQTLEVKVA